MKYLMMVLVTIVSLSVSAKEAPHCEGTFSPDTSSNNTYTAHDWKEVQTRQSFTAHGYCSEIL